MSEEKSQYRYTSRRNERHMNAVRALLDTLGELAEIKRDRECTLQVKLNGRHASCEIVKCATYSYTTDANSDD